MYSDISGEFPILAIAIVGFAFLAGGSINIFMQKMADPNADIDWQEAFAVALASGISSIPLFGQYALVTQLIWTASMGAMGGLAYAAVSVNVDITNPGEVAKSMAIGAASNLIAFGINKGLQRLSKTSTYLINDNLGFDYAVDISGDILRTPVSSPSSIVNYLKYGPGKEIGFGFFINLLLN